MSCSTDDGAAPETTTTTVVLDDVTEDDVTEETTATTNPTREPDVTSTATTADDEGDDEGDGEGQVGAGTETDVGADAADCLAGSWLLDGPQWVANWVAFVGEPVEYSSGSYVYTFSDDGTFDVAVDDFTIIIESEEEPVRAASNGTEQGTWVVYPDPAEVATTFDIVDPPDLPFVFVETTNVSVSETASINGTSIPLGEVDQDQGLDGVGPIDCDAETMVIRGTVPLPIDYPFTRM